ncbi:MAG: hypothetical protein HYZ81_11200 [Nitrospinae bacterium]|nr:hypothetical protein [Nitrospinota bacterium]
MCELFAAHRCQGAGTYFHQALTPVLVAPGKPDVIALPPAFIRPQDGHDKQDCEIAAAKRWLHQHAEHYRGMKITILGDDLYCQQPFCELLLSHGFNFILVCTLESHPTLYEWIDTLAAAGDLPQFSLTRWNGRFRDVYTYRYASAVPLRDGEDALSVNWCELTVTTKRTGPCCIAMRLRPYEDLRLQE